MKSTSRIAAIATASFPMDRKRVVLLVLIMVAVAMAVGGITLGFLYQTAFKEAQARLVETAQSRARLMEAMARFDTRYSRNYPGGAVAATLSQIREAHDQFQGFAETGEFVLARRETDQIVFLLRHRHHDLDQPQPIPFKSHLAEPMRRALSGKSGTVIGLDYREVTVLAAHEPVAVLDLGVVTKIDLAEVRAPFVRAGITSLVIAIIVIVSGAGLFFHISNPMIQRLQETEALRKSREQLALAQEIAHLGNWEWNIVDNTLVWSDEIHRIFGRDPQVFRATYEAFLDAVHPDDRKPVMDAVDASLADPDVPYRIEHRVMREDGTVRIVQEIGEVIRDGDRRPIRMMGTVQDITELKRAEQKIRDLNLNLEQRVEERTRQLLAANRELEAFTYSISHDLRAPLGNMRGLLRILVEEHAGELSGLGPVHFERLLESAEQMEKRIKDYLDLSRGARGQLRRQRVDISHLAEKAVSGIRQGHPERQVDFRIQAGIGGDCDPQLMEVVLENLLGNAWKFTARRDDAQIEFGVASLTSGERFCFIRDNGTGFDPAQVEKLFKPFERLHNDIEFQGSGIGLATVQRIIHRHGGAVWARSAPGEGATFCFTLGEKGIHHAP